MQKQKLRKVNYQWKITQLNNDRGGKYLALAALGEGVESGAPAGHLSKESCLGRFCIPPDPLMPAYLIFSLLMPFFLTSVS